ncbi:pectinesterase 1 [Cajanus cajan]|uniref:pectinesterase 1 n=1 Tax=Cajanus cajan TaxID=3821 RepID=UPI00098D96C3|nr:pectinesterase 1 [Cajanus cajan]
MDSVKIFKGYDKLQHHPNPKPKPFTATLSILAILFLTFTFAFALASILHHHHHHHHHHRTATESPQHQQLLNSAESIRVVCNVTRFPGACLAAIPPSPNATSPQSILALSLRASVHALRSVASTLAAAQGHALADCAHKVIVTTVSVLDTHSCDSA